jgi:hypothetical protein
VAYLVEALCYKPEGRGFDYVRDHWDLSVTLSSGHTITLGSTQPVNVGRTVA